MKQIKKRLLLFGLVVLVGLLTGVPALADYIGPRNRTYTETDTYDYGIWARPPKYACECRNASGACVDCTICEWERSPGSACGDATYSYKLGTRTEEITRNYANATVSSTFQCGTPGNNGWCRGSPVLSLSASEPVSGKVITYLEGSPGVLCDPADAANVNCTWTPPQGNLALEYWAHSSFGDTSLKATRTILVDSAIPSLALSVPAPNGQNGWFISPVSVSASATDSVSGIAATQIKIDSGAWQAGPVTVNGQGSHTAQAQATDQAGNSASSSVASFKIDSVAPDLTINAPAVDGLNGWYVSAPSVSVSGSDPTSGLAAAELQVGSGAWQPGSVTLTTDGTHTLNFRTRDNAGNQKTATGTYPVDTTDPQMTVNLTGTAGLAGWYRSAVSAVPSASDATSGLAALDARMDGGAWNTTFPLSITEGVHQLETRASDKAGNQASATQTVRIDTTAPTLTATVPTANGQNGWYTSAPTLKVAGTDALSGLASAQIKVGSGSWVNGETTLSQDGTHTVTFQTSDVAGNLTTQTATLKVDLTGPALALQNTGTAGQNGWYTSATVDVSATSSDATSGLSKVETRVDGGAWQSLSKVSVSGDGTHQVEFRAMDNAGNTTTRTQTVKIDTVAPQIDVTIDAVAGLQAWFRSAVEMVANAMDDTSGVTEMDIRIDDGPWQPAKSAKISQDGIYQVGFRSSDAAGNRTTLEKEVKIDQHDPIGQFVTPMGGTKVQGTVDISGTVKDGLAGIKTVDFSPDDGKSWQTLPVGPDGSWNTKWDTLPLPGGMHNVQARFTDQAGNTSSGKMFLIVANALPKIELPERWYIWESGELVVLPGDLRLMDVNIDISDPLGRWPDVHKNYSPNHVPEAITWDRRFGSILAPIGEYHVTVTVTDQLAQQVQKTAVIVIPTVPTPTTTLPAATAIATATTQPTATMTPTRQPTSTKTALPTATQLAPSATPTPVATPPAPAPFGGFATWLSILAGIGVMLVFAFTASRDRRPHELRRLGEVIGNLSKRDEG